MTAETTSYSIVVPVFNAALTLADLHAGLVEHLEPLGEPFEIILVDDCSGDESWRIIGQLAEKDPRVKGLQLMKNSGQGAATMAGLAESGGRLVVTMDDDLQNPPYEVPALLRFLEENPGIDAVFGKPRNKQHRYWRRAGSAFINRLSNAMFAQEAGFKLTSFRAIRREVVLPLLTLNSNQPPIGALVSTLTPRIINIEVDHAPRSAGTSGYNLRRLLKVSLSKFLGFSTMPLRLLATLGLLGILFAATIGAIILFRYLFGNITVPGWTTLSLLLIGISGFMFLAFGIIGEYLQQILLNSRRNPTYLVRSRESREWPGEASQNPSSSDQAPGADL